MTVELAAARQRVDDERSHARDPALPTDAPATDRLTALRAEIEKLCAQKPGRSTHPWTAGVDPRTGSQGDRRGQRPRGGFTQRLLVRSDGPPSGAGDRPRR